MATHTNRVPSQKSDETKSTYDKASDVLIPYVCLGVILITENYRLKNWQNTYKCYLLTTDKKF